MKLNDHLGKPATLGFWLGRLGQFPGDGWLVIGRSEQDVSLDTLCRPVTTDGRDLSDEEHDELDALLEHEGWRYFLSDAQLQEVVDNLELQMQDPPRERLLDAVKYYWTHDAFVELGDA